MAFQIIRHSFFMIFNNLGQALRVSIGPYAMLVVASIAVFEFFGLRGALQFDPATETLDPAALEMMSPTALLVIPLLIAFVFFVFAWVAVSWHRFILLEEYTGILPAVSGRPIWHYVGRIILYLFLLLIIAVPLLYILGLVASILFAAGLPAAVIFVIPLLGSVVLTYIWFRIGLALPSVAVGKPITMAEAWSASSRLSGGIFGVAFLLLLINGVAGVVVGQIAGLSAGLGFVLDLIVQWLTLMVGVSILTTLYGHLIEKRALIE